MPKRANESSQLSKEEFEAMEGDGEESSTATPTGSFERASPSQMSARKIVKRSSE
jgi:hypothetical protein